jgi:dienelactone hydrolase
MKPQRFNIGAFPRVMQSMRIAFFVFALLSAVICPAQDAITGFENAPASPQTPGYHNLVFNYKDAGGTPRQLGFVLYLPRTYSGAPGTLSTQPSSQPTSQPATAQADTHQYPLFVFMSGLGERGLRPPMMLASGFGRAIRSNPDLEAWLPMIAIGAQCPADARYEDDHVGQGIAQLVDEISARYRVDQTRRYLTGFSLGGTGCWSVARYAPDRFAVVAPLVARGLQPEVVSQALAGTGTTCLIISGEADAKSEPGSTQMADALRARGVDVVHAMVPKGDHGICGYYFRERRFYEWLLQHQRGAPKPANRLTAAQFVEMSSERISANEKIFDRMNGDLQTVARWWHVDNFALGGDQGLRTIANGKPNVFVTVPYFPNEIPCRIYTTTTLPKQQPVRLRLVVGRHPNGDWTLTVRVDEREILVTPVNASTCGGVWRTIDLSEWAGKEVRLQLCQTNGTMRRNRQAYWQTIRILSGNETE